MKSLFRLELSKAVLLLVPLGLWLGGAPAAQAGDRDPLFSGAVMSGNRDNHTESRQGYLQVYSVNDVVKDGDTRYFPHSSYLIYTTDGKLVKKVKNHYSERDEIPELVPLPVASYIVVARSLRDGYVGMRVGIKEDQQTILHLEVWDPTTESQLAHN